MIPNHCAELLILRIVTGDRSRVRTKVGVADGFSNRYALPTGMTADLAKLS
jgi:hypothetical protein